MANNWNNHNVGDDIVMEDENSYESLCNYNIEKCEFCDMVFSSRFSNIIHNTTHIIIPLIKQNVHQCTECLHHFTSKQKLVNHIETKHAVKLKMAVEIPVNGINKMATDNNINKMAAKNAGSNKNKMAVKNGGDDINKMASENEDYEEKINLLQSLVKKEIVIKCEDDLRSMKIETNKLDTKKQSRQELIQNHAKYIKINLSQNSVLQNFQDAFKQTLPKPHPKPELNHTITKDASPEIETKDLSFIPDLETQVLPQNSIQKSPPKGLKLHYQLLNEFENLFDQNLDVDDHKFNESTNNCKIDLNTGANEDIAEDYYEDLEGISTGLCCVKMEKVPIKNRLQFERDDEFDMDRINIVGKAAEKSTDSSKTVLFGTKKPARRFASLCSKHFQPFVENKVSEHIRTTAGYRNGMACDKYSNSTRKTVHYNELARNEKIKCPMCDLKFTNRLKLYEHELTHISFRLNCRLYQACYVCDTYVIGYNSMKYHLKTVHDIEIEVIRNRTTLCSNCKLRYARKPRHYAKHHPDLICGECKKIFSVAAEKITHVCLPMLQSNLTDAVNDACQPSNEVSTVKPMSLLANDRSVANDMAIENFMLVCDSCWGQFELFKTHQFLSEKSKEGQTQPCNVCENQFFKLKLIKKRAFPYVSSYKKKPAQKQSNRDRLIKIQKRLKALKFK